MPGARPVTIFCVLLAASFAPAVLRAQVRRVEACSLLKAAFPGSAVERSKPGTVPMDTVRIQRALQLCGPGNAVVLAADGRRDAFLSAPVTIPRGVVLFLEKGVTLYASRNRRDYDLWPRSCGVPGRAKQGCKPLLFAYQAAFSGVEGPGTIDGQGGEISIGENKSWWQSRAEAGRANRSFSVPALVSSYESQGFMLNGLHLRNAPGIHVAMYKTIQFQGNDVDIEAPSAAGGASGVLLSNSPRSSLTNFTIQVPDMAVDLRASILGPTTDVDLSNLRVVGGEGISMGDPVYNGVSAISLSNSVVKNATHGLIFDFRGRNVRGRPGDSPRNIRLRNVCLSGVAQPLEALRADGASPGAIPPAQSISFTNVTVSGRGLLQADGTTSGATTACDATAGAAQVDWTVDLSTAGKPGTKSRLVVAWDGSGDFRTLQAAVDALPVSGGEIAVKPGKYREVVTIRKPHVHLYGLGAGPASTEIVFNNGALTSGGTFNTATVFVEADDVTVDNLTMSNDLGNHGQAVALAAIGDRDVFRNVRVLGAQDTLFAASKYCYGDYGPCVPARQYFKDCYVAGNTDFIFGDGAAVFDHCELHGIAGSHVMYTAQSKHYPEQYSGYVFDHCRLTADPGAHNITLGRPWRPHATVVYLDTQMDAPVIPAGWTEWPRFGVPSLPVAYYAEFHSTGPGANPAAREPDSHQLTAKEAAQWLPARFLAGKDGWRPDR